MNQIITKISEIEATATSLIEDANEKKRAYDSEMKQKTQDFDKQLALDIDAKLEAIRRDMHEKMEQELALLKEDTKKQMELLQQEYDGHHEKIAASILQTLLGE